MKTDRKDYSYGSQGHIDLAVEAFCMAEAMMRQIESL